MTRRKSVEITMDEDLLAEVRAYAEKDDRAVSSLMAHAIRQYMKRYPFRQEKTETEEE